MKMILGDLPAAWLNMSRTRAAPTPTNISTKSEPVRLRKGTPASPATARASRGLPGPRRPGPRRPHQQHPFGNLAAQHLELSGILQEFDDLLEFLNGLIHPGHVLKGGL